MLIIGFGHRKQRGKDTCADYLVKTRGFTKKSLADSLRVAAVAIFGIPMEDFLDPMIKEQINPKWNMSPRQILSLMGTEGMRNVFGEDIWVDSLFNSLDKDTKLLVVPDVRFPNEARAIKERNGYVIRVDREHEEDESKIHSSDLALLDYKDWDFIVDNNMSFDTTYYQIDYIMRVLRKNKK